MHTYLVATCLLEFCTAAFADGAVHVQTQALSNLAIYPESAALAAVLSLNDTPITAQVSNRETPTLAKAESLDFEYNGKRYPLKLRAVLPAIRTETGTIARCPRKFAGSDRGFL